eukprot:1161229-Pelagomonas_calceolata.AAC.8
MGALLYAIGAHADKFKMRSISSPCVVHPFLWQQLSVQAAFAFLLKHINTFFFLESELLDLLLAGEGQPQADQPNSLAESLLI